MINLVSFYIKCANNNAENDLKCENNYLPIGAFDRNCKMTNIVAKRLPYNKIGEKVPVTKAFVDGVVELVNDIISNYKAKIDVCSRDVETIKSLQGHTINEKFEAISKIKDTIDEYIEIIAEYSTVKNYFETLVVILNSINQTDYLDIDENSYIFVEVI